MSRSEHADAIRKIGYRLLDLFEEDAELASHFAAVPAQPDDALRSFRSAHAALVQKVASSPPAEGKALLASVPPKERLLLLAASAQLAFETSAILRAVDQELRPAQPPQHMIGSVQKVLQAPLEDDDYLWPFPKHWTIDL